MTRPTTRKLPAHKGVFSYSRIPMDGGVISAVRSANAEPFLKKVSSHAVIGCAARSHVNRPFSDGIWIDLPIPAPIGALLKGSALEAFHVVINGTRHA